MDLNHLFFASQFLLLALFCVATVFSVRHGRALDNVQDATSLRIWRFQASSEEIELTSSDTVRARKRRFIYNFENDMDRLWQPFDFPIRYAFSSGAYNGSLQS